MLWPGSDGESLDGGAFQLLDGVVQPASLLHRRSAPTPGPRHAQMQTFMMSFMASSSSASGICSMSSASYVASSQVVTTPFSSSLLTTNQSISGWIESGCCFFLSFFSFPFCYIREVEGVSLPPVREPAGAPNPQDRLVEHCTRSSAVAGATAGP